MNDEEEFPPMKLYTVEFPARAVVQIWADSPEEALSEAGFELSELEGLTQYQTQGGNPISVYVNPNEEGRITDAIEEINA